MLKAISNITYFVYKLQCHKLAAHCANINSLTCRTAALGESAATFVFSHMIRSVLCEAPAVKHGITWKYLIMQVN